MQAYIAERGHVPTREEWTESNPPVSCGVIARHFGPWRQAWAKALAQGDPEGVPPFLVQGRMDPGATPPGRTKDSAR